jgi:hypothetical protein
MHGKMRPAESIPGMGDEGIKENGGGVGFSYDIFDILQDLCKCHHVPSPSTTMKKNSVLER